MQRRKSDSPFRLPSVSALVSLVAFGCSTAGDGGNNGNGSRPGSGGANGAGGAPVGTGDSPGSGGASAAGGSPGSGGVPGTGGAPAACEGNALDAYHGVPAGIPGVVEAENFDPEGYSDSTPGNEGGAYRTDVDVDIKQVSGGVAVGWMQTGEWLEYTLYAQTAGDYRITLRAAAVAPGTTLDLSLCGTSVATVNVAPVTAPLEFTTVATPPVHLDAGLSVMRITAGSGSSMDLDAITFDLVHEDPSGAGGMGAGGMDAGGMGTGGVGAGGMGTGGAPSTLPGDVAQAAGTPFVAAHALTRALFAAYDGPLFKALRVSDQQELDIGVAEPGGLVDFATLDSLCSGTPCKVTALYDQTGNGNDMWRADRDATRPCDLMDLEYWEMSDGTKVPIALEHGWEPNLVWKDTSQCLRNRDRTSNMPIGADAQTEYAIFHGKYVNGNCCFNYGNTGNAVHYTGRGTLSALTFSKMTFWSKGLGDGPWPMADWETGVYAGNIALCGSSAGDGMPECNSTGENPNPTVPHDIVTAFLKHNGVDHWQLKSGNAQSGPLSVNIDLASLPRGYSPLRQEGGLSLGEGGAGDSGGSGAFSEGAVIAGETSDATDAAIQESITSVYGR